MRKPKSEYSIQTVTNALRLLEAFADEEEFGVTALSERLGLHKNNVFRLLATLEEKGYVEQSAKDDRYRLGVACARLASAFGRSRSLVAASRPALCELVALLGATAHLAVLRDFQVVHLDGETPDALLHSGLRVGKSLPSHCTALGKVLLGCAGSDTREAFDQNWVRSGGWAPRTASTCVDRDKFFDQLRGVAVQGYGVDLEECEEGLACVAAPVFNAKGEPIAALSVSGPAFRFNEDSLYKEFIPAVMRVAHSVSERLGFTG